MPSPAMMERAYQALLSVDGYDRTKLIEAIALFGEAIERETTERAEELEALFAISWEADMRAIAMWREANPGNELVMPDRADLVVWLMDRLNEAADTLMPFANFLPTAEGFVERAAATPGASPVMPAVKDFRLSHFRAAQTFVAAIRNQTGEDAHK